jgi:hypothetical protein
VSTVTAPQVSEEAIGAAIEDFEAALEPGMVLTSKEEVAEFRDPFAFATWDDYTSSAILMPGSPTGTASPSGPTPRDATTATAGRLRG